MSSHGEDKSFDAVGLSKGVGSGARFPIADRFWNAKRVSPWLICYFPGPFSANDDALIHWRHCIHHLFGETEQGSGRVPLVQIRPIRGEAWV